jgi:hypothetical protein
MYAIWGAYEPQLPVGRREGQQAHSLRRAPAFFPLGRPEGYATDLDNR